MQPLQPSHRKHLWLLCVSIALGIGLRLINLTDKCLWTDELATLVFSLGHSFQPIPLDQLVTSADLLQPLIPDPHLNLNGVIEHLLGESNHPPLYFLLTHLWLQVFPHPDGLVSLWGARSLSALFGAAAVPAIFGLGYLAFHSLWIAQLAALLMATSPLAIYLAQEARHYTLPILWVMASLACLITATRALTERRTLPFWVVLTWIAVNGLGVASHYFFSLTLCAEGIVLLGLASRHLQTNTQSAKKPTGLEAPPPRKHPLRSTWLRISAVGIGTLASLVVWLPFLQGVQDSEITQWIHRGNRVGLEWLDPILQILAGAITMLYMLPIQASHAPITVASFVSLVLIAIWTGFKINRGLRRLGPDRHSIHILGGFVLGAIATFLIITYGFEREVTSAPRYHFVFFPAVLLLVSAALVQQWSSSRSAFKQTAIIVASLSLLGSMTVVSNLGYQKTHRPDIVAQAIREQPPQQSLIVIAHSTHGQTGRLMALAWDFKHHPLPQPDPLYLLAHIIDQPASALIPLDRALEKAPSPLSLWLLEFKGVPEERLQATLLAHHCQPAPQVKSATDGYRYRMHLCSSDQSQQN